MKDHKKHEEQNLHGHAQWIKRFDLYLPEVVYGSIDGIVTTFAVIAGAAGADLSLDIVLILGMANLFADGLSMSIGSYLSKRSEQDNYKKHERIEAWEIENLPDAEKKEIEDIYRQKGFHGEELKMVVTRITADKRVWLDTMMKDELGLSLERKSPMMAGMSTLFSFIIAGAIPLTVYFIAFYGETDIDPFVLSSVVTALAFILIGYIKTYVTQSGYLKSILETLILGTIAALVAYGLGDYLEQLLR